MEEELQSVELAELHQPFITLPSLININKISYQLIYVWKENILKNWPKDVMKINLKWMNSEQKEDIH